MEYNELHESKSVIVRMQLDTLPLQLKHLENKLLYALIWTTTPWSLIANQAITFSTDISYCVVKDNFTNLYIIAQECLTDIEQKIGTLKPIITIKGKAAFYIFRIYKYTIIPTYNLLIGYELSEARYLHPITKKSLPFLPGQHVTTNVGTGLVHTAPAHGLEDFLVAIENNISVVSYVLLQYIIIYRLNSPIILSFIIESFNYFV